MVGDCFLSGVGSPTDDDMIAATIDRIADSSGSAVDLKLTYQDVSDSSQTIEVAIPGSYAVSSVVVNHTVSKFIDAGKEVFSKHCVKQEKILVNSISCHPFSVMFSNSFFLRVVKSRDCVANKLHEIFFSKSILQNRNKVTSNLFFNPLQKGKTLDSSKLKEFADDNFKFDNNGRKFSKKGQKTRAISFRTAFSNDLYCRHVKTTACLGKR